MTEEKTILRGYAHNPLAALSSTNLSNKMAAAPASMSFILDFSITVKRTIVFAAFEMLQIRQTSSKLGGAQGYAQRQLFLPLGFRTVGEIRVLNRVLDLDLDVELKPATPKLASGALL